MPCWLQRGYYNTASNVADPDFFNNPDGSDAGIDSYCHKYPV